MNVKLLREVQAYMLAEPARVTMDEGVSSYEDLIEGTVHAAEPPCQTVSCIAGTAVILATEAYKDEVPYEAIGYTAFGGPGGIREQATIALDLSTKEAGRLFMLSSFETSDVDFWPLDLEEKILEHTSGTPAYAAVVSERIDRFIATEGAE